MLLFSFHRLNAFFAFFRFSYFCSWLCSRALVHCCCCYVFQIIYYAIFRCVILDLVSFISASFRIFFCIYFPSVSLCVFSGCSFNYFNFVDLKFEYFLAVSASVPWSLVTLHIFWQNSCLEQRKNCQIGISLFLRVTLPIYSLSVVPTFVVVIVLLKGSVFVGYQCSPMNI